MDTDAWLHGLGLLQYGQAFRDNGIGERLLPTLTEADLREIGVASLGHRRRLLAAVAALAGTADARPVAPHPAAPETPPGPRAERRRLTVLFCDVVDSTALAVRLDPEDLHRVTAAYRRRAGEVIGRWAGRVVQYLGDGVLACFGHPRAREDDPERAVAAGLDLVEALGALAPTGGPALRVRVGIATGLVVVGDAGPGAARMVDVIGGAPSLAARLQAFAEPGAVVVDAATRRPLGGLFECRELGAVEAKGFPDPVRAWRVLRRGAAASRSGALHVAALAPMVGRHEEMDLLRRGWARAKGGEGRAVLLSGEPGIGKSRLTVALAEGLAGEPHTVLRYFCSPRHRNSPLSPIVGQLERAAGFDRDDAPATKLGKLAALLARATDREDEIALIAGLMGPPADGRPLPELGPQRLRERLLEALLAQLAGLAARRPVLMLFEDAHWADPTSLELLDLAVERIRRLPVLLVVTSRPGFRPPWTGLPHAVALALAGLGRREAAALAARTAGGTALPDAVADQIVERAGGVPLFVEELTRAFVEGDWYDAAAEGGAAALPACAVPAALYAPLAARLDRLGGPAREAAQVGAAIGREFTHELLAAVARRPEADLRGALDRLVQAGLVSRTGGDPPRAAYLFKHALVQEAAYGTLLRARRRELHGAIAGAITELCPETAAAQPELLAHHYARAGLAGRAIRSLIEAADLALERSALAEAEATSRRALGLLPGVADGTERARLEVDLQLLLARRHTAAKGYGAPETGAALDRALALCDRAGDDDRRRRVLAACSICKHATGGPRAGLALAGRLLGEARRSGDAGGLLVGHYGCGLARLALGRFAAARAHFEAAKALGDRPDSARYTFAPGHLEAAGARICLAAVLLVLGEPDRAWAMCGEAVEVARRQGGDFTLAAALCISARLRLQARDDAAAAGLLREAQAVADAKGLAFYQTVARLLAGVLLGRGGRPREGAGIIRACMDEHARRGVGWQLQMPLISTFLVEAHAAAGMYEEAARAVGEGLRGGEADGERECTAELLRLRGCLHERSGDRLAAEADFEAAVALARRQRAKLWELRAATGLARLWRDRGGHTAARGLLAPVRAFFPEGSDLPDLTEAAALLGELDAAAAV